MAKSKVTIIFVWYVIQSVDGVFLSVVAGLLAAASIFVGKRLKLNTSARLFVITLLLITFAGDSGKNASVFAIVRVSGILLGVLIMLLLSVVVLPKSATVEALHCMDEALGSLSRLNRFVWYKYLPDDGTLYKDKSVMLLPGGDVARGPHKSVQTGNKAANECVEDGKGDEETALLSSSKDSVDRERMMENALTDMYESLFNMEENMESAKCEVLLSSRNGKLVLIPGPIVMKFVPKHLPWDELDEMADCLRKVSRTVFSLGQALDAWIDVVDDKLYDTEKDVLEDIAKALDAILADIVTTFPMERSLNSECLLKLFEAVKTWENLGNTSRLSSMGRYRDVSEQIQSLEEQNLLRVSSGSSDTLKKPEANDAGSAQNSRHPMGNVAGRIGNLFGFGQKDRSPEWYSFTLNLNRLQVEIGELHDQINIVLRLLPFKA